MIRHADEKDIPRILEMAADFWDLTDYDVPFDPSSTRAMVMACMEQRLCMVLDIDGAVGFVAGVKSPLLANHAYTVGAELAWWVEPEHRSGRNGLALMNGIEQAARDAGIDFWNMMNLESVQPEVAEKIYTRAGYKKSESTFLKVF